MKTTLFKKVGLLIGALIFTIGFASNSGVHAAVDYSGGLMDKMIMTLSDTENKGSKSTYALTDNNEATSAIIEKWNTPSSAVDHAVGIFNGTVTANAIRVKADYDVSVGLFDSTGKAIIPTYWYTVKANQADGRLIYLPTTYKGIAKVNLFNYSNTRTVSVSEFQLYNITPPANPLDLEASADESSIGLEWNEVTTATSYTIKRSTTANGPYTTVATGVTKVNYTDSDVTPGTTYYYVVTGVNPVGESVNSNEASAIIESNGQVDPEPEQPTTPEPEEPTTPEQPEQPSTNRAIFVVTMTTGLEKEFDLSMKEVNDFIDWYETKQAGSGKASYAIDKHDNNKGPFKSRKDYILFDRVLTFEVSEY
ncbi:fibronectin type III domain-containing protein [Paenibacillus sp. FSL H8-0079]|uniref:fibronectin type III domain-containing protein n=1 Tax=Paenibacillus sp. FSL H8-0079 TaxID=2921375 RepID=UPI0030EC0A42